MGSELDEKALEAAWTRFSSVTELDLSQDPCAKECLAAAIKVYRRALPAPDALVERLADTLCKSGGFETGQGTCALICMEQLGNPRAGGCQHRKTVHGKLADALRAAAAALVREPTEEQVERVAWALLKATYQHYGDPAPKNPDLTLTRVLARAAIAAMREGGGS